RWVAVAAEVVRETPESAAAALVATTTARIRAGDTTSTGRATRTLDGQDTARAMQADGAPTRGTARTGSSGGTTRALRGHARVLGRRRTHADITTTSRSRRRRGQATSGGTVAPGTRTDHRRGTRGMRPNQTILATLAALLLHHRLRRRRRRLWRTRAR
ncbi:hypothetical protein EV177_010814, partial [Coemansia sp. RSA 1804]